MIIEVRGVGFQNKGAELMLHAVVRRAQHWGPGVRLAASPGTGSYAERARLGLYQKVWVPRLGRFAGLPGAVIPAGARRRFGMVADHELSGVLDASGFTYSDQWGPSPSRRLAQDAARWRSRGARVVLLPQAFGPFRQPAVRDAFRRALEHVEVAFARDSDSLEHLQELGPVRAEIRQSPDFTIDVPGRVPDGFEAPAGLIAIVPNFRMVDKSRSSEEDYLGFLRSCVEHTLKRGYQPLLVVHDTGSDRAFAARLGAEFPAGSVRVLGTTDPIALKGVLGRAHLVIGSRFHALVSALTQGVPCLGTGWSHKYRRLLEEHGCADALVDTSAPRELVVEKLDGLLAGAAREAAIAALGPANATYRAQTKEMWRTVGRVLRIDTGRSGPSSGRTKPLPERAATP